MIPISDSTGRMRTWEHEFPIDTTMKSDIE
jgi:hypothetical protein